MVEGMGKLFDMETKDTIGRNVLLKAFTQHVICLKK